jgi:hypothetical protein
VKALLVGLAVLLSCGAAAAEEAVYLMRGATLPEARDVNGYRLEVTRRGAGTVEVRVSTALGPIDSRGAYSLVASVHRPGVPGGFELPAGLATRLRPDLDVWTAATTVLEWVTDHLTLIGHDDGPQDAVSVLDRGGGRCSGLANATAALLMAAGFEARTVSGLLMNGREAIRHRWVECRLPGAGWVPTDPTLGWWIITPRHVAFADTVEEVPEIGIVAPASDDLRRLPRQGTSMVRPNQGAELICRVDDVDDRRRAVARLERGPDLRRAVLEPEARFRRLMPGRWLLTVELDGRIVERRELTLRPGAVHSYVVRLPSDARAEVGS